jgi:hypothetical protein
MKSIATLWIGPGTYSEYTASGYDFSEIPQVGQRDAFAREGATKLAPTNKQRTVTLHGKLAGRNLHDIQTKVAALRSALSKENQNLYYHDGVSTVINNELVSVESIDIPVEWGQYESDYTVVLSYWPLDDVHNAPAAVSYGSYKFCELNGSDPIPTIHRESKVERQSADAVRESSRVIVTLSSFFEKGSIAGNLAALAALEAALATDGGTLVYGTGFSQTVKVTGWSHDPDTLQKRVHYTVQFMYVTTALANGFVKLSSMRRVSRVNQRYAAHLVPFANYASTQLLGLGPQKIHVSGYVICQATTLTAMANARIAAWLEINSQLPVGGIEEPSSTITEYPGVPSGTSPDQGRVDWSIENYYGTPVLDGAVNALYGATMP